MALEKQKLLSFALGNEEYGVSIMKVKELINMMDITPVPKTPDFLKGVVNLRGKIIPVLDLRVKFGMEPKEYDDKTCIMVVQVQIRDNSHTLGIIIDSVSEVLSIDGSEIEPPPETGNNSDSDSILGIGKMKSGVVIILDIDKIFSYEDLISYLENAKEYSNV